MGSYFQNLSIFVVRFHGSICLGVDIFWDYHPPLYLSMPWSLWNYTTQAIWISIWLNLAHLNHTILLWVDLQMVGFCFIFLKNLYMLILSNWGEGKLKLASKICSHCTIIFHLVFLFVLKTKKSRGYIANSGVLSPTCTINFCNITHNSPPDCFRANWARNFEVFFITFSAFFSVFFFCCYYLHVLIYLEIKIVKVGRSRFCPLNQLSF